MAGFERRPSFALSPTQILASFSENGPVGNRWHKVNLHAHGEGNDPQEMVQAARTAGIDLLAITDHQSFRFYARIAAAAASAGRHLMVLPGIEITAHEGLHLIALFPPSFGEHDQRLLYGFLEIDGNGRTNQASKKNVAEIFRKVEDELGGIIVTPHPFADDIGMLAPARKISTKDAWLESGHVKLFQLAEKVRTKVRYIGHDEQGNWVNRFVLTSASVKQVEGSHYCLAPFNRSDAKRPNELAEGCSWFRMSEPTIEGLKQVACEPSTRISCQLPPELVHDCILGLRIAGGYCDGQFFSFNDALTCLVGPNHAGKSAILDCIRYALRQEQQLRPDPKRTLLKRLHGILQPGGSVELFVRQSGSLYFVKRDFNPQTSARTGGASELDITCIDDPITYRFDASQQTLSPVADFVFPIEVYEQGRIGLLRADIPRQLEMLDDFAGVDVFKRARTVVIASLNQSAKLLKPLYEERETLNSDIATLATLRQELAEKKTHLPDSAEKQRWSRALAAVDSMEAIAKDVQIAVSNFPDPYFQSPADQDSDLYRLFAQAAPQVDTTVTAEADTLAAWSAAMTEALANIEAARQSVQAANRSLQFASQEHRKRWSTAYAVYSQAVKMELKKAGVESPIELLDRVTWLEKQIELMTTKKQPRLAKVNETINKLETERGNFLIALHAHDAEITRRREEKAAELTAAMDNQIRITLERAGDRSEYQETLNAICTDLADNQHRIKNREGQLAQVVQTLLPLDLASALQKAGRVDMPSGEESSLEKISGVTPNTRAILCNIANDIVRINRLQTVAVNDVPRINVRRQGETAYADLRSGLSQGEQSAAILTLALQTRGIPLILDQPEDELGYSYVVHLVVPKLLHAKFSRQVIAVSHNANVPVLGDADLVIRMENRPKPEGGRACIMTDAGCFELPAITKALIELEGGPRAFQFRGHRYSLAATGAQ